MLTFNLIVRQPDRTSAQIFLNWVETRMLQSIKISIRLDVLLAATRAGLGHIYGAFLNRILKK